MRETKFSIKLYVANPEMYVPLFSDLGFALFYILMTKALELIFVKKKHTAYERTKI